MAVVLPTLTGKIHYDVERAIKDLAAQSNKLDTTTAALATRLNNQPPPLTLAQIKAALSATGSHPLNLTALLSGPGGGSGGGNVVLVDQIANRPAFASVDIGTLFAATDRGYQTWRASAVAWSLLPGWGGPMVGTAFGPNQRPVGLGPLDAGFAFRGTDAGDAVWIWSGTAFVYEVGTGFPVEGTLPFPFPLTATDVGFSAWSTDYHRLYVWSGAGWAEGEHNDARYQVGWFAQAPDQHGWFLCTGATVQQSTATAGLAAFVTPNLIGVFPRGNNAAGGTGGHAATVTDAPSAITLVDNTLAGSTVNVASAAHTHNVATLPPYYDLLPMIRL
jgi:hypothetical protein